MEEIRDAAKRLRCRETEARAVDSFLTLCALQSPEIEVVSRFSQDLQAKRFSLPFQYLPPIRDVRI
jgi:hypothetical protein